MKKSGLPFVLTLLLLIVSLSNIYSQSYVQDSLYQSIQTLAFPEKIKEIINFASNSDWLREEREELLLAYIDTLEQRGTHPLLLAKSHLELAVVYSYNEFSKAPAPILSALNLANKHGDQSKEWLELRAEAHSKNGYIYYWEHNIEASMQEYQKALSFYQQTKDSLALGKTYNALGINYSVLGNSSKAIEFYEEALVFFEKLKNETWQIRSEFCKVVDFVILNKYEEAKVILERIIPIMKANNHINYSIALGKLGEIEMKLGNEQAALAVLNKALVEATKKDDSWNSLNLIAKKISKLHKALGEHEEALLYSEMSNSYSDSMYLDMVKTKGREAQVEIAQLSEQQTIKDLEYQQSIDKSENRNTQIKIIALFLLLLGGLVLWNYRRSLRQKNSLLIAAKETEVQKVREKLLTSITHELRSPLTLVIGKLDGMNQEVVSPKGKAQLHSVQRNVQGLLNQINQLLNWNRLEAKALNLNNSVGDVALALQSTLDKIQEVSINKELNWKIDIQPESIGGELDFQKLETIFKNLLTNAVKFTPQSGTISIVAKAESEKLKIRVSDTGVGIPAEKIDHIFDWYYRIQQDKTSVSEGFGVGLALSKELAVLMGGDIKISSQVNVGSTFILELPYQEILDKSKYLPEEKLNNFKQDVASIPGENRKPQRLLLIEDHPELAEYIAQVLSNEFEVQTMPNATQGMNWAFENLPDIIITDLLLPDKDGFEVCKTLKENILTEHIPIMILTASNDDNARIKGLQSQADAFLTKPFKSNDLQQTLTSLLQNRRRLKIHYNRKLSAPEEKQSPYIDRLIEVLENNFQDSQFNVDAFAQKLRISRSQLFVKTKSLLGISPSQFIKQYRLEMAQKLLQKGELLVSEVAFECGFASHAYFSTVYKEHFKINPHEEREVKGN